MSLINEALKRAKAAQEQTPPPSAEHLPLHPVDDPEAAVTHGIGLALPVAFAVVALLLLFFAWRIYMDRGQSDASPLLVAAKSGQAPAISAPPAPAAQALAVPDPEPAPVQPAPTAPSTNAALQAQTPAVTAKPVEEPKPQPEAAAPAAAAPASEPAAPKLPPLALQGVVYSRTRPSAVINGKTVFVGERIREYRVIAITPETATLVGNGQTNVLMLPD